MFVKKVICGATFYGVGEAVSDPENTLIVDRNAIAGHEFIESINPGTGWHEEERTDQAKQFRGELVKRNILTNDGKIHLPAVYPLLCQEIDRAKLDILFLTEIVHIEKNEEGRYNLTLHNASGFQMIQAESIVDTTSEGLSFPTEDRPTPQSKAIHAYLFHDNGEAFPEGVPQEMTCIQGRFPNEIIGKFAVSPEDQWVNAREKLHTFWAERPSHLRDWTITTVAGVFNFTFLESEMEQRQHPDWRWSPSCQYQNLLTAYDHGLQSVNRRVRV